MTVTVKNTETEKKTETKKTKTKNNTGKEKKTETGKKNRDREKLSCKNSMLEDDITYFSCYIALFRKSLNFTCVFRK